MAKKKKKLKVDIVVGLLVLVVFVVGLIYLMTRDKSSDKNATTGVNTTEQSNTDITSANNVDTTSADGENTTEENTTGYAIDNFEEGITLSDEIMNLPSDIKSLGYNKNNVERDEYNRPVIIERMQDEYGKYNTYMIGDETEKKIYLTFTIAYEYSYDGVYNTDRIMNILKEKNVPAAFFITGEYTERFPEMCRKIVDNGFIIGCHGYNHPSDGIASLDPSLQIEDNQKIYNAIYDVTGVHTKYYRPGSGIWNERSIAILNEMGFTTVLYSYTYFDYDVNNQPDENEAYEALVSNLHNGEIIYLHTVSNTNVAILERFIDKAISEGYTFASIDELER